MIIGMYKKRSFIFELSQSIILTKLKTFFPDDITLWQKLGKSKKKVSLSIFQFLALRKFPNKLPQGLWHLHRLIFVKVIELNLYLFFYLEIEKHE